jgi:hypothetical protein
VLTDAERALIRSLAEDMAALWSAPTTTPADRQRVVHCLVERITVTVDKGSNRVAVRVTWAGGRTSEQELIRPVSRYDQLADHRQLVARAESLSDSGMSLASVANRLNEEGFYPPKRACRFTGEMVGRLLRQRRGRRRSRPLAMNATALSEGEWWLSDLAGRLVMPVATVLGWIRRGGVHARKLAVASGRWAVWADADEVERLKRLHACPRTWDQRPVLADLMVPKRRPQP